jgi:hypothetical protein
MMKKLFALTLFMTMLFIYSCSKEKRFAIATEPPIEVSACRATLKATGKNGTSKKISEKGFCFVTSGTPFYDDNTSPSTNGFVDLFEAEVKGLLPNTQYFVRAYTKLSDGTIIYGSQIDFRTNGVYMPGDKGPAGGIIYATDNASSTAKFSEAIVSTTQTYSWGCYGNELSSLNLTGSGLSNSNSIQSSCGSDNAASYCLNLTMNGFSDWYLPSAGELSLMYSFSKSNGDAFPAKQYWSSSQWDANLAYGVDFAGSSSWVKINKNSSTNVIAVRNFN